MSAEIANTKRVVLLGASVGKAWNIVDLPGRVGNNHYFFEYIGCYRFDKSDSLREILQRESNKPAAVILKECAAYFPGDIDFAGSKKLMTSWIEQSRKAGVVPIPATVAPVTRQNDERYKTTNPLKRIIKKILGISMMTQMDRVAEYNDWLRDYSDKNGIAYLDLEAALRISEKERYLRDDLTSGDGLHLNDEAYRILDGIVIPTLNRALGQI